MRAVRLGIALVLAAGALSVVGAPGAYADNPPCRMNPREFRNVRVENYPRKGMTRRFVQQMVGCGGRTEYYVEYGGGFSYRLVSYKRTTPVGSEAYLVYVDDRVQQKSWSTEDVGPGFPFPIGFPGF
jgi:hypothetical protein